MSDEGLPLRSAVTAKRRVLAELRRAAPVGPLAMAEAETAAAASLSFGTDFTPGRFENLAGIRLAWVGPDLFHFIPRKTRPFAFIRHTGERIEPRNMVTDGGSVPKLAQLRSSLSAWGYAPAYLIHDWEFEAHHCGRTPKSFDEVRLTCMEAVKTLMRDRIVPDSWLDLTAINFAIGSPIAWSYWNRNPPACTLPPDRPE